MLSNNNDDIKSKHTPSVSTFNKLKEALLMDVVDFSFSSYFNFSATANCAKVEELAATETLLRLLGDIESCVILGEFFEVKVSFSLAILLFSSNKYSI